MFLSLVSLPDFSPHCFNHSFTRNFKIDIGFHTLKLAMISKNLLYADCLTVRKVLNICVQNLDYTSDKTELTNLFFNITVHSFSFGATTLDILTTARLSFYITHSGYFLEWYVVSITILIQYYPSF